MPSTEVGDHSGTVSAEWLFFHIIIIIIIIILHIDILYFIYTYIIYSVKKIYDDYYIAYAYIFSHMWYIYIYDNNKIYILYSDSRFRSSDLWVMSPTRYRCAKSLYLYYYYYYYCCCQFIRVSLWNNYILSFGHTMVETPDPIRTLKLSIIGLA